VGNDFLEDVGRSFTVAPGRMKVYLLPVQAEGA